MTAAATAEPAVQQNRGTIFVEDAVLLRRQVYACDQFVLRLAAPSCAHHAIAGSFVHIRCDEAIPMRRPLSIMRANPGAGWIEVLFKVVGSGLRALGDASVGDTLSIIGPIGQGFRPRPGRPGALLVGGGVGIPPLIFLAEQLCAKNSDARPFAFMGSEIPFPFDSTKSTMPCEWLPRDTDATLPLLEDWGVCTRLASLAGFEGCYNGYVTDLARRYLGSLNDAERARCEIFSCGPTPMLDAVASLAREFDLPCQVALEEFMACAVGGCAGCAVEVQTPAGPAMKRVCVDGPVFDAYTVFGDR